MLIRKVGPTGLAASFLSHKSCARCVSGLPLGACHADPRKKQDQTVDQKPMEG